MQDFYEVRDEEREYLIVFKEAAVKSKVYMMLRKCSELLHEQTLIEMTELALKSGARTIYLRDALREKEAESSCFQTGEFRFVPSHKIEKMQLTELLYRKGTYRGRADGDLRMVLLTGRNAFVFMKIYNESFFDVSNSATYSEKDMEELLSNKECPSFIFYEEETPVGVAMLQYEEQENGIEFIGVAPEFQGKGYGRRIMMKILDQFFEEGCEQVALTVSDDNEKAKELYRSLGFQTRDLVSRWYRLERMDEDWKN